MSETSGEPSQDGETRRSRFTALHARTFEMELLLSGAVVFGLVQLPPMLRRMFSGFEANLAGDLRLLVRMGQTYVELALYALIGAFVLHLAARGYWIGLLGLESVFPDGIRWDRVKNLGPLTRARYRNKIGTLADAVDRVDDLCSMMFSFALLIVFSWIYSIVLLVAAAIPAFAVSRLVFGGAGATVCFWVIIGGAVGIQLLAGLLDRWLGSRVRPDSVGGRLLGFLVRTAWVLSPLRWIGQVQFTLGTNLSPRTVGAAVSVVTLVMGLTLVGGVFAQRGLLRLDNLAYFPDTLLEQGVDPGHYRALRGVGEVDPLLPTIQSDIPTEPYVKLFFPYLPRVHNQLVSEACPELAPLSSEGLAIGRAPHLPDERVAATAACLGSLFAISLDGQPLPDLRFDFAIEPDSGLKGIAAYLRTEDLEPGRHELAILVPPKRKSDDADERVRHVIPFWK